VWLGTMQDREPQAVSALIETVHPEHQHWPADDSVRAQRFQHVISQFDM
jgi:hypothetical protein